MIFENLWTYIFKNNSAYNPPVPKLEYDELVPVSEKAFNNIEALIKKGKFSLSEIKDQLKDGIPKHKRGEFWNSIVEHRFNVSGMDTTYSILLENC